MVDSKDEKRAYNFKMTSIYNLDTEEEEAADYFLQQNEETVFRLRRSIHSGKKRYACPVCMSKVILKVSKLGNPFFSHTPLKEGQVCFLVDQSNTETRRIQEYNYHKESEAHIFLKETIAWRLKRTTGVDSNSVKIEKVIKGQAVPKTWKKPDVQFMTKNSNRFAVEIQLSNTWLSDIVKRELFYQKEGISILWVFDSFSPGGYVKTTKKDIFYNNPFVNIFVFNEDAANMSDLTGDLHLDCYFKFPEKTGRDTYMMRWQNKLFNIKNIRIDKTSKKPYFVDTAKHIKEAEEWCKEQSELIKKEAEQKRAELLQERKRRRLFEERAKKAKIIVGRIKTCDIEVFHVPTNSWHRVTRQKKNASGEWYFTENHTWLFAKDCMTSLFAKDFIETKYTDSESLVDDDHSIDWHL